MIHSTQSGWVGQKVSVDISSNDSTASAEFSFKTKCRNKSKLSTFTSKTTTTSTPPLGSRNKIFVLLPRDWDVFLLLLFFCNRWSRQQFLLTEWPSVALFECGPERTWVQIPSKVRTTFHQRRSILGFSTYRIRTQKTCPLLPLPSSAH